MTANQNQSELEKQAIKAAKIGDLTTIENLIALGVDVNTLNTFNENLLFIACENSHYNLVLYLITNQAALFQINSAGRSILNATCKSGNVEILKLLLDICDHYQIEELKNTLDVAYSFYPKNFAIFEYLLNNGYVKESDIRRLALRNYKDDPKLIAIFELIFSKYSQIDTISSIFSSALENNQIDALQYIVNRFPQIKTLFTTYFTNLIQSFCIYTNQEEIIDKSRSEILSEVDLYPYVCLNPSLEFLLQNGLTHHDLDQQGKSFLHNIATYQHHEYEEVSLIKCLLDIGYPINLLNEKGQTPLHVAIEAGMMFHAIYLIYRGADVNIKDSENRSPMDYSHHYVDDGFDPDDSEVLESRATLIKLLTDFGAKIT